MSVRPRSPGGGAPPERGPEAPPPVTPAPGANLPAATSGDAGPSGLAAPLEGLGTALQLQAEILKRLHDQQQKMGEALADTRRSELMIQSTQALNESFTGMRRVQERLLDKLDGAKAGSRLLPWSVGAGLLVIAAAIWWGVDALGRRVDATGDALKTSTEGLAAASVDAIEKRLETLEGRDTKLVREELDRLRSLVGALGEEKAKLSEERDRAREDLGAARDRSDRLDLEVQALRTRAETAEKEQARLTGRTLADQQLVDQLNRTVENLRTAAAKGTPAGHAAPVPEPPPSPAPAAASGAGTVPVPAPEVSAAGGGSGAADVAAKAANGSRDPSAEVPVSLPEGSPVAGGTPALPASPPAGSGRVPVAPEFLASLNGLIAKHRGSDVYAFVSAREMDSAGLYGVVLEVRGPDGALSKTVEAEKASILLTGRSSIVEITFETGFVHFQQVLTKAVKSPFFNNRYQVILIGVDPQGWMQASLPFLAVN